MAPALGEAAFLCVDQMFVKEYNDSLASSVAPPCAARAAWALLTRARAQVSTVVMRWNKSYAKKKTTMPSGAACCCGEAGAAARARRRARKSGTAGGDRFPLSGGMYIAVGDTVIQRCQICIF
jgi:hypothetical protein